MKKSIILCITIMLSILSLYAGDHNHEEKGFTVTYLMMQIQNIELPQDQTDVDSNSSENEIRQYGR